MNVLQNITGWLADLTKIMFGVLGVAILAELLFGQFLGSLSVVANVIDIVGKFGDKGFVGLIAMLLVLGFVNKDK
jgi:hypothetical protein